MAWSYSAASENTVDSPDVIVSGLSIQKYDDDAEYVILEIGRSRLESE